MHSISLPAVRPSKPSGMMARQLLRWMTPNKPELWFFAGSTA